MSATAKANPGQSRESATQCMLECYALSVCMKEAGEGSGGSGVPAAVPGSIPEESRCCQGDTYAALCPQAAPASLPAPRTPVSWHHASCSCWQETFLKVVPLLALCPSNFRRSVHLYFPSFHLTLVLTELKSFVPLRHIFVFSPCSVTLMKFFPVVFFLLLYSIIICTI